jgi:hypothetical protein
VLRLVLHPINDRPGIFVTMLGERRLVRSRQPMLDGARVLLAEGVAPETVIEAGLLGEPAVAMRSTVGEAADGRSRKATAAGRADGSGGLTRARPARMPIAPGREHPKTSATRPGAV